MIIQNDSDEAVPSCGREAGSDRWSTRGNPAKHECVTAAAALLEQARAFVASIDAGAYSRPCPAASGGTIGGHVRHCLDHFAAAIGAAARGSQPIDYDHRDRDVPMERQPAAAIEAIENLCGVLADMPRRMIDAAVVVRIMVDSDGHTVELISTLGRELAFATHHALHHHAMMKFIADAFGLCTPPGFGKAPSTINHERTCTARLAG